MTATAPLFDPEPYTLDPLPVEPLPIEVTVQVTLRLMVDAAELCTAKREEYEALDADRLRDQGYREWERGSVLLHNVIAEQSPQCIVVGPGIHELPGGDVEIGFRWEHGDGEALADRMIPKYPSALFPREGDLGI